MTSDNQTSCVAGSHAKTSAKQDNRLASPPAPDQVSGTSSPGSSSNASPLLSSSKTLQLCFGLTTATICRQSSGTWNPAGTSGLIDYSTHNTSEWPNDAAVCSLSQVVEASGIPQKYYLSPKACAGILHRAEKRRRRLPPSLLTALEHVAQTTTKPRPVT